MIDYDFDLQFPLALSLDINPDIALSGNHLFSTYLSPKFEILTP